jgi:4a-hydroxytetrahydrobiopterin dehydratase
LAGEAAKLPDRCVPCEGGVPPLGQGAALDLMAQVPGWELDYPFLKREYVFPDFKQALDFVNRVGALAESQGHHPDIHLTGYKRVELVLFTHAIDGLSENDFVMARAINGL